MKRCLPVTVVVCAVLLVTAQGAWGQGKGKGKDKGQGAGEEPEMTFETDEAAEQKPEDQPDPEAAGGDAGGAEPEPDGGGGELDLGSGGTAPAPSKVVETRVSWQDIMVVVRKPFLKVRRLELLPQWGITMNDNIIRHYTLAGQLNYYLTDVLAVGLEGQLFAHELREPFDLVARQARRLPTVNQYNWGASFNFHYVPIYGKFAILDKHLVHWETYFTAGVGVTESEVLPRDPRLQPFKNMLITPNVGAAMRFFLTRFLTVNVGIRDYAFIDKFEAPDRNEIAAEAAKENAEGKLINHVMFLAGVSFWFPMSFEYTTFR